MKHIDIKELSRRWIEGRIKKAHEKLMRAFDNMHTTCSDLYARTGDPQFGDDEFNIDKNGEGEWPLIQHYWQLEPHIDSIINSVSIDGYKNEPWKYEPTPPPPPTIKKTRKKKIDPV